jgi:hypothetical protein
MPTPLVGIAPRVSNSNLHHPRFSVTLHRAMHTSFRNSTPHRFGRLGLLTVVLAVYGLALAGGGWFIARVSRNAAARLEVRSFLGAATAAAFVRDVPMTLEFAWTPSARMTGLSGRDALPPSRGLLMVFPAKGRHGIWMRDMRFPIDIFWLDEAGRIVALRAEVLPETFPTVFEPSREARFVLETEAGFAERHALRVGDRLSFP